LSILPNILLNNTQTNKTVAKEQDKMTTISFFKRASNKHRTTDSKLVNMYIYITLNLVLYTNKYIKHIDGK